MRDRIGFARDLRDHVHRWTGIPNCVGIGPTKVLAKTANKIAKRGAGWLISPDTVARAATLAD